MRSIEVVHAGRQNPGEWEPPDICIEAVGHQTETLNDCFELVRKRGTVVAFGVPDQPVYAVEFETFFRKNAHLIAVVTPEWSRVSGQVARPLSLMPRGTGDTGYSPILDSRRTESFHLVRTSRGWYPQSAVGCILLGNKLRVEQITWTLLITWKNRPKTLI